MKILLIKCNLHHKNLSFILKCKKINFYIVENISYINKLNLEEFDCVISPCEPIDVSKYPKTKFIFGPQFSVLPTYDLLQIKGKNSVYNLLSEWVINIWKKSNLTNNLHLIALPFGVDTDKFINILPIEKKEKVLVYFKHRNKKHLYFIENYLKTNNINYELFSYDKTYNEIDYINCLQNAKYGIWIDAHESQGFALQEALSCDVPLLVWNVKSMSDEFSSTYKSDLVATTIPYWNSYCGEYFYYEHEFIEINNLFLSKLITYKPRDFILNNLSIDVCENKLIEVINNIKI
jgi:hypothetical protein